MLRSKKVVSRVSSVSRLLTASILAATSCWTFIPGMAVAASSNDYRACAGRLLSAGVTPEAASQGCANSLRPRDLAACVAFIEKRTQISAADALSTCEKARNPKDVASCVAGISRNTEEAVNAVVLDYCGRSLFPVTFAQCVVGLRSEIELSPNQALDTCIDASDSVNNVSSSSTPPIRQPGGFNPTFDTTPVPTVPTQPPAQPNVPAQPDVPAQPNVPAQPDVPAQPGT